MSENPSVAMKMRAFFWILAGLTYGVYYFLFGSISVQGYATPPVSAVLLDIVTGAVPLLLIALLMALVAAFFPRKQKTYTERFWGLWPVLAFYVALAFLVIMWQVGDQGPVRP